MTLENSIAIGYSALMLRELIETCISYSWKPKKILKHLVECLKCCTFWTVLIVSQDLKLALLASLSAYIMDSYITTRL